MAPFAMKWNLGSLCPFKFGCFEYLLEFEKICCPHLFQNKPSVTLMFSSYRCKRDSITLWIIALFKSFTPLATHFYCCLTCWKLVRVWVFSASRAVIGGKGLTAVSLSWAQRAQQIDSPCLLPFNTDRLRAWALSQHYQSIRSYPQSLTLIGGQLPKGQGSMNHSPAMRSCSASKYTCCGSNSLRCFAINDDLASDCHSPGTKL